MKSYPSISTNVDNTLQYHIFDKLDGSNIRADWEAGNGFTRFGSRKKLLFDDNQLANAKDIICQKYESGIADVFDSMGVKKATCFFEYLGPNSFAGKHPDAEDQMNAVLIDMNLFKHGMIDPQIFLKNFEHLHIPNYLGFVHIDNHYIECVKNGTLNGVTFEGIVCKTRVKNKLKMTKIKSNDWLNQLKLECEDEEEFLLRS